MSSFVTAKGVGKTRIWKTVYLSQAEKATLSNTSTTTQQTEPSQEDIDGIITMLHAAGFETRRIAFPRQHSSKQHR